MKSSLKKPGDFTVAEGHGHPLVPGKDQPHQELMILRLGLEFEVKVRFYRQ